MTYLVSYCIYTAATINVYEIKFSESGLSSDAAPRLNVSLKVLETEARQTPGIRRSIEIIKHQLRTWTHQQQEESVERLRPSNPIIEAQNTAPPVIAPYPYTTQLQNVAELPVALPNPEIRSFNWNMMDTGAGFQPDAFHWTLDDTWIANSDFDVLEFPPAA